MSDLSRFLRRQESNVRGMYDKNLGQFVEDWKRPFTGAAAGLGAGALASMLPGVGAGAAAGLMAGGATAGGAAGYQRTKQRQAQWAAAEDLRRQNEARAIAGDELGNIIDPYLPPDEGVPSEPTPYEPPGTPGGPIMRPPVQPGQPPVSIEPSIDPVTGQPVSGGQSGGAGATGSWPPVAIPGVTPGMGELDVSGPAGRDVGSIMDEAERARQMQMDLWNQQQQMRGTNREELANILNQQMERQYQEGLPDMYEDLNTRGLLRSSHLGESMAEEKSRMASGVNEQLALQAIQQQEGAIGGLGGIQNQYLQSRQGALGRRFSLEDYAQQMKASQLLGQAAAPIQPYTGGGKSGAAQAGMAGAGLGMSAAGLGK